MPEDFHVTIDGVASSPPEQPGDGIVITNVTTNSPVGEGNNLDFTITYYNAGDNAIGVVPEVDVAGTTISGNFEVVASGVLGSQTVEWSTSGGDDGDYVAVVTAGSDSESVSVTVAADAFLLTLDSLTFVQPATFDVFVVSTTSPVNPGGTLDVTVDVTNTGDEVGTQTVTLNINNSVGQVDSTSVTLSGGGSVTKTLSWSVPSGQTEQDYTATVASADDSASQTVTVSSVPQAVVLQPESTDKQHFKFYENSSDRFDIVSSLALPFEPREFRMATTSSADDQRAISISGLDNYPQVGKKTVFFYHPRIAQCLDSHRFVIYYTIDDTVTTFAGNLYGVRINGGGGSYQLVSRDKGNLNVVDSTQPPDKPQAIEILHEANGDVTVDIYDISNLSDGDENSYKQEPLITSLSGNDDALITNGTFDNQGIGFQYFRGNDDRVQLWRTK